MKILKIQSILLILSSCKNAILSLRGRILKFRLTRYHSKDPLFQLIYTTHIGHLTQTRSEIGQLSSVNKPQRVLFSLCINLKHITTRLPRSASDFVSNICHVRFFHVLSCFSVFLLIFLPYIFLPLMAKSKKSVLE